MKYFNYFYKITNNINNHFYYGVHCTNDLNDGYMGSGKRLLYAYKKYGIENFSKEILKFFDTPKEAFEYEAEIVTESLCQDPNCYNIQQGERTFHTKGLVPVRDKDGNTFLISNKDQRYLSGELVPVNKGIHKGIVHLQDKEGNNVNTTIDDPRYLSGELHGYNYHKVTVKDKNGNFYVINNNDPRYLSGELVGTFANRKHSKETIQKMKNTHKNLHIGEKNSQFGTCWIHNEEKSIKIKKGDLSLYENEGWIKGRKIKF